MGVRESGRLQFKMVETTVPPETAEIVMGVRLVIRRVVTVNVAVTCPAGIARLAGSEAASELLLDSQTVTPPDGAGAAKVTVPATVPPPMICAGVTVTEAGAGCEFGISEVRIKISGRRRGRPARPNPNG